MQIYMLDNGPEYMSYWFVDEALGRRLMGRDTGHVALPEPGDLPLRMEPSFGNAKDQPTEVGDFHRFSGARRLFSERAVDALSLSRSGQLFPVELEGRDEQFYWYWSTTVVDCLDESRTKRLLGDLQVPAFFEDRIYHAEVFTTPDDQKFQFHLFVTAAFKEKIKKAKLKGFVLRRGASDSKPWKS